MFIINDNFVDSEGKCYGTIKEEDRLFTGTFENRLKNGFGYYIVTSGENKGDKFEGNWVNNVENGWGKYTEVQGFNLAGKYVDGELTSPYLVNGEVLILKEWMIGMDISHVKLLINK